MPTEEVRRLNRIRARLSTRVPVIGPWLRRRALGSAAELARAGSPAAVALLGHTARDGDADLTAEAVESLFRLALAGSVAAREELCRCVIWRHNPELERRVLAEGLVPRDDAQKALFHFLTGRWRDYEALDFDHRLLRSLYETGGPELRARIATQARAAGRLELVEIAPGRSGRRLRTMGDEEWKAVLSVLQQNAGWDAMWKLAQEAPPRWTAPLLRQLSAERWHPADDDAAGFEELVCLAGSFPAADLKALLQCRAILQGHGDEVRALAFGPDLLATGGADRDVRLWRIPDGKLGRVLTGHQAAVNAVAFSPDGRLLASADREGIAFLWDITAGRTPIRLKGHSGRILRMAITPDGELLATAGTDGSVQLWSLPAGDHVERLDGHDGSILGLVVTPDGDLLATAGADCTVRLWQLPTGKAGRVMRHGGGESDAVVSLALSPDGTLLASGGTDGLVQLWSLPGGSHADTIEAHSSGVSALAFSPDSATLVTAGLDRTLRFWDLADTGRPVASFDAHSAEITHMSVSPDGALLATVAGSGVGHDLSVRLWDLPGRKPVRSLYGHARAVSCLAFSPDGPLLATGSADGMARLWSAELHRLAHLPSRQASLADLAFIDRYLTEHTLDDAERSAWEFVAALIRRQRRTDVLVGDATPRLVNVGAYDIEIEG